MIIQAQVGPQSASASLSPGLQPNLRLGNMGDLIASELHGRYYEAAYRGTMFGVQGVATTTTAGTNATFTGLAIGNPTGSGVNLVLNKVGVTQVAALTVSTNIGIMFGPATLPITGVLSTVSNRKVGGPTSVTTSSVGQTITAPTQILLLGGGGSGAMTVPGVLPKLSADLEGSLIIPPGYFFASYTSLVSTTALLFDFQWEEVPI